MTEPWLVRAAKARSVLWTAHTVLWFGLSTVHLRYGPPIPEYLHPQEWRRMHSGSLERWSLLSAWWWIDVPCTVNRPLLLLQLPLNPLSYTMQWLQFHLVCSSNRRAKRVPADMTPSGILLLSLFQNCKYVSAHRKAVAWDFIHRQQVAELPPWLQVSSRRIPYHSN